MARLVRWTLARALRLQALPDATADSNCLVLLQVLKIMKLNQCSQDFCITQTGLLVT